VSASNTDVQFPPRPAPARTVLLDQPFSKRTGWPVVSATGLCHFRT
jgi:hypothetical protein